MVCALCVTLPLAPPPKVCTSACMTTRCTMLLPLLRRVVEYVCVSSRNLHNACEELPNSPPICRVLRCAAQDFYGGIPIITSHVRFHIDGPPVRAMSFRMIDLTLLKLNPSGFPQGGLSTPLRSAGCHQKNQFCISLFEISPLLECLVL